MGPRGVGVFIQVRMGSQRLPGKALLPLGDSTVIEQVMRALREVEADAYALLTDESSAAELGEPARRGGFDLRVGAADDVLSRYARAASSYGVEVVVRATGDSPLVSPHLVREILLEHESHDADLSHYLGCPLGTGVETIRSRAIQEADSEARDPKEREHMSTYLYRHRDRFRLHEPWVREEWRCTDANVSVDSEEDYERVRRIYADLYEGRPIEVSSVASWLREHPREVSLKSIAY